MISEALQKAREYEAHNGPAIPESDRPAFHATPTIGWMNDPNGFSFYKGECHLFYQYHPYSNEWGPMHWGHLKTKDFIRWERLPAALAPDESYDADGCFSGSAVQLPDGRQLLMYTGVRREQTEDGHTQDRQTQCIAIGDGINYEKAAFNPVLSEKDLPEGGSPADFRDPKAWREEDGRFYAVIGNRTQDGSGAVLLYQSEDGLKWEFVRTLDRSGNQYGRMWECPDFFSLDGSQVLLTSPQDMAPIGLEFHAGNGTLCLIGGYDPHSGFTRRKAQAIDYGLDFYAPQTLQAPDGRRIMIAWMQNWNTVGAKPCCCRWFGQQTIPRELSIREGRLIQLPVRELENYRGPAVLYHDIPLSGETGLPGVQGRILDMTVTVRPAGKGSYRWFRLHLAKGEEYDTILRYRPDGSTLKIDRCRSGLPHDVVHTRSFLVRPQNGEIKLRVILDRFSLEVFVNDGEQAASAIIYPPQQADAIRFEADGQVLLDVEKYALVFDSSKEKAADDRENL
ncbi:MAG: glycoside hydrolase family 32 protein [Provencibacterium sp.]|jgi:beta-fructofuranosidase|nr:glycoside hydrolase family 32 protein [Provencibacterium sp.]